MSIASLPYYIRRFSELSLISLAILVTVTGVGCAGRRNDYRWRTTTGKPIGEPSLRISSPYKEEKLAKLDNPPRDRDGEARTSTVQSSEGFNLDRSDQPTVSLNLPER